MGALDDVQLEALNKPSTALLWTSFAFALIAMGMSVAAQVLPWIVVEWDECDDTRVKLYDGVCAEGDCADFDSNDVEIIFPDIYDERDDVWALSMYLTYPLMLLLLVACVMLALASCNSEWKKVSQFVTLGCMTLATATAVTILVIVRSSQSFETDAYELQSTLLNCEEGERHSGYGLILIFGAGGISFVNVLALLFPGCCGLAPYCVAGTM